MFNREELQDICMRATEQADKVCSNPLQVAYINLACSADCLDAMMAREEVSVRAVCSDNAEIELKAEE